MAAHSLEKAREQLGTASWREAAMFARGAIELAMKSISAAFGAVSRTHDPGTLLDAARSDPRFPASLVAAAGALLPLLAEHGLAEYLVLSYGDEEKLVPPWELVDEARARRSVDHAERALSLADAVIAAVFDV